VDIDYGSLLDKAINAYGTVSVARINRDSSKFEHAGAQQANALHRSESVTPLESYRTGNAADPAKPTTQTYFDRIPKPLLYGSAGVLGLILVLKAVK